MRRAIVSAGILIGAIGALALASAGRAQVAPFPPGFRLTDIETDGARIHVRVGGKRPGGGSAARLRRHRRHVGAGRRRARGQPYSHRPRFARDGALVASGGRIRQDDAGARHCSSDGRAQSRQDRARDPRHRQHGRLCARRAIPRPRNPMGRHRRAAPGHRPVGRDHPQPGCSGTSISAAPTSSGSSPGASASISTGSGTSSPPIRRRSPRRPGDTMRSSTRCRARCIRRSTSSPPSRRTPPTTRLSPPRASSACLYSRWAATIRSATQMGDIMELVASNVTSGVIKNSGHWVMEEQPAQTTAAIIAFIDRA